MKRKRNKPPSWFVLVVLIGAVVAGAILAALIATTME